MRSLQIKRKIGKFLMSESGSISKKSVISLGITAFLISSAPTVMGATINFVQDTSATGYNADVERFTICGTGQDGSDDSNTKLSPQPIITLQNLLDEDLIDSRVKDTSAPDGNGTFWNAMFNKGYGEFECAGGADIKDHVNDNCGSHLSNHFSGNAGEATTVFPDIFLHGNNTMIQDQGFGMASNLDSPTEFRVNHDHDALFLQGFEFGCHASDHYSTDICYGDHTNCNPWCGSARAHWNNRIC